jgi:hypothetical protein
MIAKAKPIHSSASQFETFDLCNRKWWFEKTLKLPTAEKPYFTFGTVLHACIERWLLATDNGRVPWKETPWAIVHQPDYGDIYTDGPFIGQSPNDPVEIFPEGWETITEGKKSASVTPNEARLIRRLFQDAIEKGILERHPDVGVEHEINLPLTKGVILTGFLDFYLPRSSERPIPEIHDHKSFGESSKRYLKQPGQTDANGNLVPVQKHYVSGDGTSPNDVAHNQQLLTYAWAISQLEQYTGPVKVRHNQFPKFEDPKGVRKVESLIGAKRIAEHGSWLKQKTLDMLRVRGIKQWQDTPRPATAEACSAFGGCPFLEICGRRATPEVYRNKVERLNAQRAAKQRPNLPLRPKKRANKKKETMGTNIFAGRKDTKTTTKTAVAATKGKAKPAINPKDEEPEEEEAEAEESSEVPPPWANSKCNACKGKGFNSKGRPCPICDGKAKQNKTAMSSMYEVELTTEPMTATAKDDFEDALTELGAPLFWSADGEGMEAAADAAPDEDEEEAEEEEAEDEPAPKARVGARRGAAAAGPAKNYAEEPDAGPKANGRPRAGPWIFMGTAMLRGPTRPMVTAQELMVRYGADLAAEMGAEHFMELDQKKRQDRLKQAGPAICEGLGRTIVVFPGGTNDFDLVALFNALAPHAELVVERLG